MIVLVKILTNTKIGQNLDQHLGLGQNIDQHGHGFIKKTIFFIAYFDQFDPILIMVKKFGLKMGSNVLVSQQEMTLRKSDKGKEVVEHTPLSSRDNSTKKHIPRWI